MGCDVYEVLFLLTKLSRSVFKRAMKDGNGKLTLENLIKRYEVRVISCVQWPDISVGANRGWPGAFPARGLLKKYPAPATQANRG